MKLYCTSPFRDMNETLNNRWVPLVAGGKLSFPTSGTTGESKLVVHEASSIIDNAVAFNKSAGIDRYTRMYHCLPLGYMGGFLNTIVSPAVAGGFTYIGNEFNPLTFWQEIRECSANAVWVSPTMAAALVRLYRGRRGSGELSDGLGSVFCGFAPLPSSVRREWIDVFDIPLQESYGTSELMLVSVQSRDDAMSEENAGTPIEGVEIAFDDCELYVSSKHADPHYIDASGFTRLVERCGIDGKFIWTGDLGYDLHGKLTITGRSKDLIKRGGEAVNPYVIEQVATSIHGIKAAAAVGQPDDFWGQSIVLFVEYDDQVWPDLSQASVKVFQVCRTKLPQSHWPDELSFVFDLPRTETGKILKSQLIETAGDL